MSTITENSLAALYEFLDSPAVALFAVKQDIAYDQDLARIYFNEFEAGSCSGGVQMFGLRQTDYMVIYNEDIKPTDNHFDLDELEAMSIDDLLEIAFAVGKHHFDETVPKNEIVEELYNLSHEDYYTELYAENSFYDLEHDDTIYGYCQGDVVRVKFVGKPMHTNEELVNLFYDVPISGTIQFIHNGETLLDFHYGEYAASEYKWDKDEFIGELKKYLSDTPYSNVFFDLLENELPSSLKYTY